MWVFGDNLKTGVKVTTFPKMNRNSRVPTLEEPNTGIVSWESEAHYNATKNEDALKRCVEQTDRCYSVLEGRLAKFDGESILPGGLTALDAHYEPWMRQCAFAQVPIDKYSNLKKWSEKTGGLKEVQKAYERIQMASEPGES